MDKNTDHTSLKFAGDLLLSAPFKNALSFLFNRLEVCVLVVLLFCEAGWGRKRPKMF